MKKTLAIQKKCIAILLSLIIILSFSSFALAETPTPEPSALPSPPIVVETPVPVPETPAPVLTQEQIINGYIKTICEEYGVEPEIVQSIVYYESRYDPQAKNGQFVGLMQVSKSLFAKRATKLGVTDFYDPYSNILLGVDFLAELITTYKSVDLALMLYSMNWKEAFAMHKRGQINNYASLVLKRAKVLKQGVT